MLLEAALAAVLIKAWHAAGKKGKLTPEREEIYVNALEHLEDPGKLRKLAVVFDSQGLYIYAAMLRRRADLRDLPEETRKARRESFDKGMANWTNADGIERLAAAFEAQTATGAAEALRAHAKEVRAMLAAEVLAEKAAADKAEADKKAEEQKVEQEKAWAAEQEHTDTEDGNSSKGNPKVIAEVSFEHVNGTGASAHD